MKKILIVVVFACLGLTVLANIVAPTTSTEALAAKTPSKTPTKSSTMYVNATANVNVRSCASTSCAVVTTASPGQSVRILDEEDDWYKVKVGTKTGYIAGFLLTTKKPSSTSPTAQPRSATARPTLQAPQDAPAQPTAAQAQQPAPVQPTQVPQSVQPTAIPAPAYSCDCGKACGAMASCEEAYFQLNSCGCGRRDGDNDGVPCEEICSGG